MKDVKLFNSSPDSPGPKSDRAPGPRGKRVKKNKRVATGNRPGPKSPEETARWQKRYVEAILDGCGYETAAVAANVRPGTAQDARRDDPDFNLRVEAAKRMRLENVDRRIYQRGMDVSDRLLLAYARAHLKDLYGKRADSAAPERRPVTVVVIECGGVGGEGRRPVDGGPVRELGGVCGRDVGDVGVGRDATESAVDGGVGRGEPPGRTEPRRATGVVIEGVD